jgi:hypothetical protein
MAEMEQPIFRLVSGAAAGVVASFAMKRVMSFLDKRRETGPSIKRAFRDRKAPERILVDKAADTFGWKLKRRKKRKLARRVRWGMGAATGVATAWLRRRLGATDSIARGALFGASIFFLADEVLKPAIGARQKPTDIPWQTHARAVAGHATYGLVQAGVRRALKRALPV